MSRQIKFRVWNKVDRNFSDFLNVEIVEWHINSLAQDEFIIQQFTGLKDKNGCEIYEGDICRSCRTAADYQNPKNYEIQFHAGSFFWNEVNISSYSTTLDDVPFSSLEVVGNIFRNPEIISLR